MKPARATRPLSASEIAITALVGGLVVVGKTLTRMPISLPGHGGVLWIAALIVGRCMVKRPWAATMMSVVGGLLVAVLQPSNAGLFAVAKYAVPGLMLDAMFALFSGQIDRPTVAAVTGAAAHGSKVLVDIVIDTLMGLPTAAIYAHIGTAAIAHVAFGALGGLAAAGILAALRRARIPQLAADRVRADAPRAATETDEGDSP